MLFRLKEVVLPSSAPLVDDATFWDHAEQLTLIRLDLDTVNAMSAGVVKFDPVFPVLAADQQQEID